ncbi:MAG TPA: bifunctional methylenetetrahydrofolate dehydrogenase/methenyltetrahydrofolate cyclohydrolase FolD [Thermoanaerobaculia bacterium]|nr:bifunctional methylenetetrahydrofolate dehydrogenase/methenyltetrahydrofolate cyclohydrolase FolD [Thermoanaerobaculia bacterium]
MWYKPRAVLIDGKQIAAQVESAVRAELAKLRFAPGLTVIRVGNDPASEVYVRNKARKAKELGLRGDELIFPDTMSEAALLGQIETLNSDNNVDGILVQLPLPKHIDPKKVIRSIDPEKDVDGFHPINVGLLHLGQSSLVPCTPAGVIRLIASTGMKIEGARAVVIGRSDIVGKPVAALLLNASATVTICHSRTRDLPSIAREADILVAAIGKPRFVTRDMVRKGAVVIDVGINRVDGKLVGDVDFENVKEAASAITPVPGGVGPMTIAMLMRNTVAAAKARRG